MRQQTPPLDVVDLRRKPVLQFLRVRKNRFKTDDFAKIYLNFNKIFEPSSLQLRFDGWVTYYTFVNDLIQGDNIPSTLDHFAKILTIVHKSTELTHKQKTKIMDLWNAEFKMFVDSYFDGDEFIQDYTILGFCPIRDDDGVSQEEIEKCITAKKNILKKMNFLKSLVPPKTLQQLAKKNRKQKLYFENVIPKGVSKQQQITTKDNTKEIQWDKLLQKVAESSSSSTSTKSSIDSIFPRKTRITQSQVLQRIKKPTTITPPTSGQQQTQTQKLNSDVKIALEDMKKHRTWWRKLITLIYPDLTPSQIRYIQQKLSQDYRIQQQQQS